MAERKNNYSKSDESKINQRTISAHLRKIGDRFLVSYFLTLDSHNGIKIGIESEGDPDSKKKEKLLSSLEKFKKEKCDIILCAIRYHKGERCDELYEEVNDILGNINMEVRLSNTEAKMTLDLEYFKTILGNKNNKEKFINKDIYKRVWITNIYTKYKSKQAECNEKSAELIYELIEKAIKELSE